MIENKYEKTKICPKYYPPIVNDHSKNILEKLNCSIERSLARILNEKAAFKLIIKTLKSIFPLYFILKYILRK